MGSATFVAADAELATLSIGTVVVGWSGLVSVVGTDVVVGCSDKRREVCVRKEN